MDSTLTAVEMQCDSPIVTMYLAPEFSSCLAISSALYVGLRVVMVRPAPAHPRKAEGNSDQ